MQRSTLHFIARISAVFLLAAGAVVGVFGATAGAQSGEDDPAMVEAGQEVFESNCAGCHGVDGGGSTTGRPLQDVALEKDRGDHITSVTEGISTMPAFGDRLSAEEIDAAVSYVRLTFVSQAEAADDTAEAEATEELAQTGAASRTLVMVGVAMLLAGLSVTRFERRLRN